MKELVKRELLQAIKYFIERQCLVAQAMLEMGLDLKEVGKYGAVAWVSYKDAFFFCRHLEWQLDSLERQGKLQCTRQWVQQSSLDVAINLLVREMRDEGLINADWTLPITTGHDVDEVVDGNVA